MIIKIQHINIYTVLLQNYKTGDTDVLFSFYTRQDAIDYMRSYARRIVAGGGELTGEDETWISCLNWYGHRLLLYWVCNRLTTLKQLANDRQL